MTKETVAEALLVLSTEFGVKPPKLSWRKMRGGRYHPKTQTISMGPRGDWERVVLHEFAHHLDHCRNKPRASLVKKYGWLNRKRQTFHDVPFRFCLLKVAAAWYGDESKYPWQNEYTAIQRWYKNRAVSQPPIHSGSTSSVPSAEVAKEKETL